MRVIDEQGGISSTLRLENLALEDWYEALCRLSVLKALPTDAEVVDAGAEDGGDFMLALRKRPSEYEAWITRWNETHDADLIKATQPPHRCITHLVLLMVRTIEGTIAQLSKGNGGAYDRYISKKEMKQFMRPT